jgi:hypothetical protein
MVPRASDGESAPPAANGEALPSTPHDPADRPEGLAPAGPSTAAQLVAPLVLPLPATPAAGTAARRARWPVWQWLAVAASFALAFALGAAVRSWLFFPPRPGARDGIELAHDSASRGTTPPKRLTQPQHHTAQPERPANDLVQHGAGEQARAWGKVRIVSQRPDGQPEVIELPVYEGTSLEEHLARVQNYFPQDYLEQLRRAGYEVTRQAELIPFDLEDGRQLIVPSQRIEVVPTGYRPWQ